MSFLNKQAAIASGESAVGRPLSGVLADLPAVTEYLTAEQYPDGSRRERATILLFREAGVVKACLSDRDLARTLWRAGDGVETALMALEEAVAGGSADWRVAAGARPGGRPNRK